MEKSGTRRRKVTSASIAMNHSQSVHPWIKLIFSYVITLTLSGSTVSALIDQQPQQVHLAFGVDAASSLTVTWVTRDELTELPRVEYGQVSAGDSTFTFPYSKTGETSEHTDNSVDGATMYIHRVYLSQLTEDTHYYYHVGTSQGWSSVFTFRTLASWPPEPRVNSTVGYTLALYGNLGNENAQSLARLQDEVARGKLDFIVHLGDIAINLDDENGRIGDQFMSQIEPIASTVAYQVIVGDHEAANNLSHYNARFTMIDAYSSSVNNGPQMNNQFYSFNVGPVHFVAFSTEVYFSSSPGTRDIERQFQWLQSDLKEANKEENRRLRPWIVTLGHRPMYTSINSTKYSEQSELLRTDALHNHSYSLEDLFYSHKVDVVIASHGQMYERMYPMYNYTIFNSSSGDNEYVNAGGPVHLTTSSAGSSENVTDYNVKDDNWSARRIFDFGYTVMYISNSTHIRFDQVSDDQNGKVVDSFTMVKDAAARSKSDGQDEETKVKSTNVASLIRTNSSVTSAHENKSNKSHTESSSHRIDGGIYFSSSSSVPEREKPLSESISLAPAANKTRTAGSRDIEVTSSQKDESKNNSTIS